jgi:hypothetical protein
MTRKRIKQLEEVIQELRTELWQLSGEYADLLLYQHRQDLLIDALATKLEQKSLQYGTIEIPIDATQEAPA